MTGRAPAAAGGRERWGWGGPRPGAPAGASSQPRGARRGHRARRSRRQPPGLSGWARSGSGGGVTCVLPRAPPALQAPGWDVGARLARRALRLTRHLRFRPLRSARGTPSRHLPRLPAPFLPLALRAEESEATSSRKVPQSPARLSRRPSPSPAPPRLRGWGGWIPGTGGPGALEVGLGMRGRNRPGRTRGRKFPMAFPHPSGNSSFSSPVVAHIHGVELCSKVVGRLSSLPPIHLLIHSHLPHSRGPRSIRVVGEGTREEENQYLVFLEKQQYFNLEMPKETAGAPQADANHMQSYGNLERKPRLPPT